MVCVCGVYVCGICGMCVFIVCGMFWWVYVCLWYVWCGLFMCICGMYGVFVECVWYVYILLNFFLSTCFSFTVCRFWCECVHGIVRVKVRGQLVGMTSLYHGCSRAHT